MEEPFVVSDLMSDEVDSVWSSLTALRRALQKGEESGDHSFARSLEKEVLERLAALLLFTHEGKEDAELQQKAMEAIFFLSAAGHDVVQRLVDAGVVAKFVALMAKPRRKMGKYFVTDSRESCKGGFLLKLLGDSEEVRRLSVSQGVLGALPAVFFTAGESAGVKCLHLLVTSASPSARPLLEELTPALAAALVVGVVCRTEDVVMMLAVVKGVMGLDRVPGEKRLAEDALLAQLPGVVRWLCDVVASCEGDVSLEALDVLDAMVAPASPDTDLPREILQGLMPAFKGPHTEAWCRRSLRLLDAVLGKVAGGAKSVASRFNTEVCEIARLRLDLGMAAAVADRWFPDVQPARTRRNAEDVLRLLAEGSFEELCSIPCVSSFAFSPKDSRMMAVIGSTEAGEERVGLFDIASERSVWSHTFQRPTTMKSYARLLRGVALAPDGWLVAVGLSSTEDTGMGKVAFMKDGIIVGEVDAHREDGYALGISASGRWIAVGNSIISVHERVLEDVLACENVSIVRFSPVDDNCLLVGTGHGGIAVFRRAEEVWDMTERFSLHNDNILSLCFSKDGTRFISSSRDGQVIVWALGESQPLSKARLRGGNGEGVSLARYLQDENLVLTVAGSAVQLWDTELSRVVAEADAACYFSILVLLSEDEKYLAFSSGGMLVVCACRASALSLDGSLSVANTFIPESAAVAVRGPRRKAPASHAVTKVGPPPHCEQCGHTVRSQPMSYRCEHYYHRQCWEMRPYLFCNTCQEVLEEEQEGADLWEERNDDKEN